MSDPNPGRVSSVPIAASTELTKPFALASPTTIFVSGGGGFDQPTFKKSPNSGMVCSSIDTSGSIATRKSLCVGPDGEKTVPELKKPLT